MNENGQIILSGKVLYKQTYSVGEVCIFYNELITSYFVYFNKKLIDHGCLLLSSDADMYIKILIEKSKKLVREICLKAIKEI